MLLHTTSGKAQFLSFEAILFLPLVLTRYLARERRADSKFVLSLLEKLTANLEQQVSVAERDLPTAARRHPMYGLLLCVRSLVLHETYALTNAQLNPWVRRVYPLCMTICKVVGTVLNCDSPEGQTPTDSECDAQTLLLCCWRSSKEASHLLAALISRLHVESTLDEDAVDAILTAKQVDSFLRFVVSRIN